MAPLWQVSPDAMTMTMDIHPEDCFNDPVSASTFLSSLPKGCMGVDKDALGQAVAKARTEGVVVQDVVVARGRAPEPGEDGCLELKFDDNTCVGIIGEDGSMDFRERGGIHCVSQGEEVAILQKKGGRGTT